MGAGQYVFASFEPCQGVASNPVAQTLVCATAVSAGHKRQLGLSIEGSC